MACTTKQALLGKGARLGARRGELLRVDILARRVYRDRENAADDGLAGVEETFSICSFWLVEALTRAGRLEEARQNLEQMLTYANHLGLYSEEVGPVGEALGNFPQAFTHLALIRACHALDQALGGASLERL